MDSSVSAVMTPVKTIRELYCVANSPEAICVLSPHSDMKMRMNPDRNEFLKCSLPSFVASFCLSMSMPKVMKMVPDAVFSQLIGTMFIIHEPSMMAVPSTIRKASITPSNRCRCFLVLEDKSSMDNCVLSPNSARLMATRGISRSVIMVRLLWV